ncbi:MAG: hypothetical protein K2J10_02245 [Muribaculaceae bacterium]|nr:hypothetical protein [Muribaculaceae bacterium]
MKLSVITTSIILLSALCACSDSKSPYHGQVVSAAQRDAAKVIQATPGSMEREHAVLAILVRQHALSSNGHEAEADLYYNTAHHILVDSLHIIDSRQINESAPSNQ